MPTRYFVLYASSFRYESAPNISHETIDKVLTLCGRKARIEKLEERTIFDFDSGWCAGCD